MLHRAELVPAWAGYVGPVLFEPDSVTVFPDRCMAHIVTVDGERWRPCAVRRLLDEGKHLVLMVL